MKEIDRTYMSPVDEEAHRIARAHDLALLRYLFKQEIEESIKNERNITEPVIN